MESLQAKKIELGVQESPVNNFLKILMIALFVVVIGFGSFLYISSMQKNKITNDKSNKSAIVSITPTPTLEPDPSVIDIGNIETDLEEIGKDVKNLQ